DVRGRPRLLGQHRATVLAVGWGSGFAIGSTYGLRAAVARGRRATPAWPSRCSVRTAAIARHRLMSRCGALTRSGRIGRSCRRRETTSGSATRSWPSRIPGASFTGTAATRASTATRGLNSTAFCWSRSMTRGAVATSVSGRIGASSPHRERRPKDLSRLGGGERREAGLLERDEAAGELQQGEVVLVLLG